VKTVLSFIKKVLTSEYLSLALRIYIGWIFIDASMSKIPDPAIFAENVANYRIIPFWGLNFVAIFLPWLELFCGFYLIFGLRTKATAAVLSGLLFLFTLFVIINIFRGSKMNCGCFDTVGDPIGWEKVGENTLWLLMTVQVFFFDRIHLFRRGGYFYKKKGPLLSSGSYPEK
jgi:putative oxidoreductase